MPVYDPNPGARDRSGSEYSGTGGTVDTYRTFGKKERKPNAAERNIDILNPCQASSYWFGPICLRNIIINSKLAMFSHQGQGQLLRYGSQVSVSSEVLGVWMSSTLIYLVGEGELRYFWG